ncbi:DUF4347 domain-containing protein [Moorena producens JHB]|uniref:DUF4347 domain-containing protein n=1 Tax=Moorena producens (strain JHB) TaxID=1454205 RepID=A0A1D9G7K0_MOOP1|nr:DUF4347 domain-containing protein [Moorena producens]AOY83543.2 DUF4347 domain-containing protein [Moorena producens JHB]
MSRLVGGWQPPTNTNVQDANSNQWDFRGLLRLVAISPVATVTNQHIIKGHFSMFDIKYASFNDLDKSLNFGETEVHKVLGSHSKTSSTIVFIDSGVDDYQSLVNGTVPEAEVIVLDSTQDGVEEITKALQGRTDITAIHIVSHGSPGCLYLGNSQLSLDTLNYYAPQLKTWSTTDSPTPILLYGCNVATVDAGTEFLERLHQITGTEIAASANRTGNAALGGDWNLECCTAEIAVDSAFLPELMQVYQGVFAVSFSNANNFAVGNSPASIATGDFDHDGDLDLVTANSDSDNVSVLLNNGAGSYSLSGNFAVGRNPVDIAVGDFNQDGNLDLVTADFGTPFTSSTDNTVSVLLGNGNGTFGPATQVNEGDIPLSVVVGDFDGDQDLDVAVGRSSGIVSVLFGNGMGSFPLTRDFTTGVAGFSTSVGDFNNDGNLDIVTGSSSNEVSLLLGNPTTTFNPSISIPTGVFFAAPDAVGDFDKDGNLDLVIGSNSGLENEIAVLLGNGDGSFGSPMPFTTGGGSEVAVGDFNGDHNLDIAAASDDQVSLLLGNGAGGFTPSGSFDVGTNPSSITVGDFNSDGKPDIATANSGSDNVSVLLNTTSFSSSIVATPNDDNLTLTPKNDIINLLTGQDIAEGLAGDDFINGDGGDDNLFGDKGNDTLLGGSGQDELYGGSGDDSLKGGDGDDNLFGEAGNDTLLGGQGQDQLFGGSGNDLLKGGQGDNILTGGAGKDTFVLSTAGKNTIVDFEDGLDLLQLEGGLTFGSLSIFEQNGDTWITTENNQPLATLTGVEANLITAKDFIV